MSVKFQTYDPECNCVHLHQVEHEDDIESYIQLNCPTEKLLSVIYEKVYDS